VDLRLLQYFVTVAEERHVGRAATRLHMTQPPLSRAIRQLEGDLGVTLFERTPQGVTPTAAGETLYDEARALLEQAGRLRVRVRHAAGSAALAIGTLADTAGLVSDRLVTAFRQEYPHVTITVHEADLNDPSAGLRAGLADVAFTRTPFDDAGLRTLVLAEQPVGVVVRADDPLTGRESVAVAELDDRAWVRLPEGTDTAWAGYWTGTPGTEAPVMRTIQECLQSVLWNGMSALAPLDQPLPSGLALVPVRDRAPSRLVLAWPAGRTSPLVQSFVRIASRTPFRRP
jgi:DNA-binding transcriptional LysR family regulator